MLFTSPRALTFSTEIEMKKCRLCLEVKPEEHFGKRIKSIDGLRYECRACRKIESKEAYAKDPEKSKQMSKAWAIANKDKRRQYEKAWARLNMKKCVKALSRYRKKNPEKFRAYKANRRARELNAHGTFSDNDVKKLILEQGGKCKYCKTNLEKYHVDHKMPLTLGGSNSIDNLQVLCPSCNVRKSSKHPEQYEKEIGYNNHSL